MENLSRVCAEKDEKIKRLIKDKHELELRVAELEEAASKSVLDQALLEEDNRRQAKEMDQLTQQVKELKEALTKGNKASGTKGNENGNEAHSSPEDATPNRPTARNKVASNSKTSSQATPKRAHLTEVDDDLMVDQSPARDGEEIIPQSSSSSGRPRKSTMDASEVVPKRVHLTEEAEDLMGGLRDPEESTPESPSSGRGRADVAPKRARKTVHDDEDASDSDNEESITQAASSVAPAKRGRGRPSKSGKSKVKSSSSRQNEEAGEHSPARKNDSSPGVVQAKITMPAPPTSRKPFKVQTASKAEFYAEFAKLLGEADTSVTAASLEAMNYVDLKKYVDRFLPDGKAIFNERARMFVRYAKNRFIPKVQRSRAASSESD